ncbi:hypothetical protein SARC_12999, partial [Sphaeroforma arctica JP610]
LVRITHAKLKSTTPPQRHERLHKKVLLHNLLCNLKDEMDRGEYRTSRLDAHIHTEQHTRKSRGIRFHTKVERFISPNRTSNGAIDADARIRQRQQLQPSTSAEPILYGDMEDDFDVSYNNDIYDGSILGNDVVGNDIYDRSILDDSGELELMDDFMPAPDYFDEGLGEEDTYEKGCVMNTDTNGEETHMNMNIHDSHMRTNTCNANSYEQLSAAGEEEGSGTHQQAEIMHLGLGALLDQDDVGDTYTSDYREATTELEDTARAQYSRDLADTHMVVVEDDNESINTYTSIHTDTYTDTHTETRLGRVGHRASVAWDGSGRRPRSKSAPGDSTHYKMRNNHTTPTTKKSNLSRLYHAPTVTTTMDAANNTAASQADSPAQGPPEAQGILGVCNWSAHEGVRGDSEEADSTMCMGKSVNKLDCGELGNATHSSVVGVIRASRRLGSGLANEVQRPSELNFLEISQEKYDKNDKYNKYGKWAATRVQTNSRLPEQPLTEQYHTALLKQHLLDTLPLGSVAGAEEHEQQITAKHTTIAHVPTSAHTHSSSITRTQSQLPVDAQTKSSFSRTRTTKVTQARIYSLTRSSTGTQFAGRAQVAIATPSARVGRLTRPIRTTTNRARHRLNEWCVRKACRDPRKNNRDRYMRNTNTHKRSMCWKEATSTHKHLHPEASPDRQLASAYTHVHSMEHAEKLADADAKTQDNRDGAEITNGPVLYDRYGVKITSARVCVGSTAVALRVVFDTSAQRRPELNYTQILYT